mgnify:CR=1 FL=1
MDAIFRYPVTVSNFHTDMKLSRYFKCGITAILTFVCCSGCVSEKISYDDTVNTSALVRPTHPRLFFNEEDISTIRTTAFGRESAVYEAMKTRIDELMTKGIEFVDPLAATGESNTNHEYGFRASESAILYLISGERKYLDFTKTLLKELTEYYLLRVRNNLNIAWYAYSQICTLCAYDWIYNDLTEDERHSIGRPLFEAMYDIAWHGPGIRASRYRENVSDHKSGCYGVAILPWYLSIAFYGDGIDDAACIKMFDNGYNLHQQMIDFRSEMAGEKGGGATACAQYSFGYYPLADFNFIYTYRSAKGVDLSEEMDYVLRYLDYLDWIALPGNREYGFGDVHHYDCLLPRRDINYHITEIANLYGNKHPEVLPHAARLLSQFTQKRPIDTFPFIRLLHTVALQQSGSSIPQDSKHSIYFNTMGQVYMRSGVGEDDTYALFVSGGVPTQHKHYDNNNFIIYKHGYRALDSGTRPEPGLHLSHYYARTVAHNCITIRMPGEVMPEYWGGPAACEEKNVPVPNDGGQRELLASELLEMKETDDYVYLASDATKSYHKDKAELVVREFIYCMPDVFVVFDRVVASKPEFPKTWLIHTAAEPQMIASREFSETSQGGKMICRTLFPQNAKLEKIGGPDKQFWSDGRNWPLPILTPEDYGYSKRFNIPPATWPQIGQWRMEVTPGMAAAEDRFMHIIQVGDESLSTLPETATFENDRQIGVEFEYRSKKFRLAFDKKANHGCEINVTNQ